jgi:DNA ligase (NAD+)
MQVPEDAQARAAQLRDEIEYHNDRYFVDDEPEVTDAEFDTLVRELRALESKYPSLVVPDSPTQRPGGAAASTFAPVKHRVPMLSLDNAFSHEELQAWADRASRVVTDPIRFVAEPKMDGLVRERAARARRHARRWCNR